MFRFRPVRRFGVLSLVLGLVLVQAACAPGAPPRTASAGPAARYVGQMTLTPTDGQIGSTVTVGASGLPADTAFELVWQTVSGSWILTGAEDETYAGRAFRTVDDVLRQVRSGSAGQLRATFTVPPGFGFDHTVMLMQSSTIRNQALFVVQPQVSLASSEGSPGSPITITMTGIGAQSYTNNWMVLYDNTFTGWISAVTTAGTAHFSIPATGGPGKHIITIVHGAYTFPYLNPAQSPHPKPEFDLTYTVTAGPAVLPPPPTQQGLPTQPGAEPAGSGRAAWVSPAAGPVQTPLLISARDLPPGQTVALEWQTVVGSRVTSSGWSSKTVPLGQGVVAPNGTLSFRVAAPDDLGGVHRISVVGGGGTVLATTQYTITPSAMSMGPTSGPDGTPFTIRLQGVGWTDTSNIYTLVYDNAYTGYVCGFNSQGDVTIHLEAAGRPGWHFIDLYPGIYKGSEIEGTDDFRLPQLTFAADHPGQPLPAFHFAFYVTGSPPGS